MSVTAADLKARFQPLACLDDAIVDRWIAEAARNLNATQWGPKYDDGLAYLAAHLIATFETEALATDEPGAGPVTGEKEGSVSYSISPLVIAGKFRKDSLGATKYGRRYRELLATIFVTRCI